MSKEGPELLELRERLQRASTALTQLATHASANEYAIPSEANRLRDKAEGVRLALSYVEEYLR